jgi:tetratricopeptide (TPR) repeat protein
MVRACLVSGERLTAERELADLLKRSPNLPEAWALRGDLHFKNKRYDEAAEAYKKAVEQKPDDAELIVKLGEALFQQKKYGEAEEAFRRAHELSPKYTKASIRLADSLLMQGRMEEARELFKEIGADPEFAVHKRLEHLRFVEGLEPNL